MQMPSEGREGGRVAKITAACNACKRSINETYTRSFILYMFESSHNIICYRKDNAGILDYDKQVYLPL